MFTEEKLDNRLEQFLHTPHIMIKLTATFLQTSNIKTSNLIIFILCIVLAVTDYTNTGKNEIVKVIHKHEPSCMFQGNVNTKESIIFIHQFHMSNVKHIQSVPLPSKPGSSLIIYHKRGYCNEI
jgi:hypothetical protein